MLLAPDGGESGEDIFLACSAGLRATPLSRRDGEGTILEVHAEGGGLHHFIGDGLTGDGEGITLAIREGSLDGEGEVRVPFRHLRRRDDDPHIRDMVGGGVARGLDLRVRVRVLRHCVPSFLSPVGDCLPALPVLSLLRFPRSFRGYPYISTPLTNVKHFRGDFLEIAKNRVGRFAGWRGRIRPRESFIGSPGRSSAGMGIEVAILSCNRTGIKM